MSKASAIFLQGCNCGTPSLNINAHTSGCPVYYRGKIGELQADNRRLRTALENIMLHQKTVCPTGTKMSATYQIAAKAFDAP